MVVTFTAETATESFQKNEKVFQKDMISRNIIKLISESEQGETGNNEAEYRNYLDSLEIN